jgi:hypothetical protein
MAWTSSHGARPGGATGPAPIGKITVEIYHEGPGGAAVSINIPQGSPLIADGAVDYVRVQQIVADAIASAAAELTER